MIDRILYHPVLLWIIYTIIVFLLFIVLWNSFISEKILFFREYMYTVYLLYAYLALLLSNLILQSYNPTILQRNKQFFLVQILATLPLIYFCYVNLSGIYLLIGIYLSLTVTFILDSRFALLFAGYFLSIIPFNIILQQNANTEQLAIYAYLFFLVSIVAEVYELIIQRFFSYSQQHIESPESQSGK